MPPPKGYGVLPARGRAGGQNKQNGRRTEKFPCGALPSFFLADPFGGSYLLITSAETTTILACAGTEISMS